MVTRLDPAAQMPTGAAPAEPLSWLTQRSMRASSTSAMKMPLPVTLEVEPLPLLLYAVTWRITQFLFALCDEPVAFRPLYLLSCVTTSSTFTLEIELPPAPARIKMPSRP